MSYDLFFKPNDRLTREAFESYFSGRNRYELTENQAWYRNEDTGVYLLFEWDSDPEQDFDEESAGSFPVSFNINYFRPHIFGLEAEPELTAFIAHFDLSIFDSQLDGMSEGPYSGEGFLKGWNVGNRFAAGVMAEKSGDNTLTLPEAELTRTWRWNFEREKLQGRLGPNVFVPKIMFMNQDGVVKSLATWVDGIPLALPRVDMIVLAREELAPRHFFFFRRTGLALVPWEEAGSVLEAFRHQDGRPEFWLLDYLDQMDKAPRNIRSWFVKVGEDAESLTDSAVAVDQIITAEYLPEVSGRITPE